MLRDSMEDVFIEVAESPKQIVTVVIPQKIPQLSGCHALTLGISCSGIVSIILYYFIEFVIQTMKNPTLN